MGLGGSGLSMSELRLCVGLTAFNLLPLWLRTREGLVTSLRTITPLHYYVGYAVCAVTGVYLSVDSAYAFCSANPNKFQLDISNPILFCWHTLFHYRQMS